MSHPTRRTITSNILWRLLERTGAQSVTFVVSLILARLLDPEVYGLIAIISVITNLLTVFIDCGCGTALIQKQNTDDTDFSSVFYFNIISAVLIYGLIFFFAPAIQSYYALPNLALYIRVSALNLLLVALKSIQSVVVAKQLIYKKFFFSTLLGTLCAAIIGIFMAFRGFGVWALIVQGLVNNTIDTIILWCTVRFRPKQFFSFRRLKELIVFSWKLVVVSFSSSIFESLKQLLIGKIYSSSSLAFYNRGHTYPEIFSSNLNTAIESVLFPAMSKGQDDLIRLKNLSRRAVKTTSYIIFPTLIGLALCSRPLISLILTDKWFPCVQYMWMFCIFFAFMPLQTANNDVFKALGRVDLIFKICITKIFLNIVSLIIFVRFDLKILLLSFTIIEFITYVFSSIFTKKLIDYGLFAQIRDFLPNLLISLLMALVVFLEGYIPLSNFCKVLIQVPTGILLYFLLSKLFHIESYSYLLDVLKNYVKEKPGILQRLHSTKK